MEQRIAVDQSVMSIQLALDGKGVALGRSPLSNANSPTGGGGALPQRTYTEAGYWVIHRKRSQPRPARSWPSED